MHIGGVAVGNRSRIGVCCAALVGPCLRVRTGRVIQGLPPAALVAGVTQRLIHALRYTERPPRCVYKAGLVTRREASMRPRPATRRA